MRDTGGHGGTSFVCPTPSYQDSCKCTIWGNQCPIYVVEALRSVSGSYPGLFFGFDDADLGCSFAKLDGNS